MSGISALGGMPQGMMRSFAPPSFSSLDDNSDGGITLDELQSNAPGSVSDAQSQDRAAKLFSQMDSDGDGTVTSAEKDTFDAEIQDRMSQMQFSTQMMASTGGPQGSGGPDLNAAVSDILSALDSNSDGSVSADEISSFLEDNKPAGPPPAGGGASGGTEASAGSTSSETYDPLDTNEDGVVSLAQRLAATITSGSGGETTRLALDMLSAALSAYSSTSGSSSDDFLSTLLRTVDAEA